MTAVLALPGRMDSNAAAGLRDILLSHRGVAIDLRADSTRFLGTLCAQVLVAAAKTWAADGVPLTLRDPSPPFLDALALLGLTPADVGHAGGAG